MSTKIGSQAQDTNMNTSVPASAARDYITDMLRELCEVAAQSGQEDLHVLLKLTTRAARNSS